MRAATGSASTYVVGVAPHVVQNLYLADGTKVRATDDRGRGYEYLGSLSRTFLSPRHSPNEFGSALGLTKRSLRLNVNGEEAEIESIPFAGGRIVKTSNGYEPHYYVTDHLGSTRAIVRPAASGVEIMAEYDYMPYGTQHIVAEAPTADADYKYTGKEQQGAFGMYSLYDSQARFQNVTSGCFLSQDPLSTKFPETTPYIYCGGDPINRVDPDEKIFTPLLNHYTKILYRDIHEALSKNNDELKKLIEKGKSDGRRAKRLRANNAELYAAISEILILKCSDQLYDINLNAVIPPGGSADMEYFGWLTYSRNRNAVVINLTGDYNKKTLLHEFKHGFQFETQMLSFNRLGTTGGIYYNFEDEVEAHQRGSAIDGSNERASIVDYEKISTRNGRLSGKIDPQKIGNDIWKKTENWLIKISDLINTKLGL